MKNKFIAILMFLVLIFVPGCDQAQSPGEDIGSAIKSFIKGDVTGQLNKSYSTQWFDFTVEAIKTAYTYGEYEVDDGYKFVVVTVSETNTFYEPIPMSSYDFFIEADGLLEEDSYPVESFDDTMMPEDFELDIDETQKYNILFAIPDEIVDVRIVYIELDEEDNVGATFTIHHSL